MPKKYVWITVRVANCADRSMSALRAHENAKRAFHVEGDWGLPDIVMFQEVSSVNVRQLGFIRGYDVLQFGRQGAPEAGVAIASAMSKMQRLGSSRMAEGSKATAEGGGIRKRVTVTDRYRAKPYGTVPASKSFRSGSGHAPPSRSFIARAAYIASLRTQRGIIGLDSNFSVAVMKATSVRKWRGHGVLGVLVPLRYKSLPARTVDIGSDHPAVDVRVRIPVREARR